MAHDCRLLGGHGRTARVILVLAACCSLLPSTVAKPVKAVRRVLFINSLGPSYPFTARIDEAIRNILEKSPYQIELYHEYLETVLFPAASTQQRFRQWYINKYRDRKPDVIIAIGSSAIRFMSDSHKKFFPETPIVFCGGISEFADNPKLDSQFTGAWMVPHPANTLDAALKLQPGTKHVVVVGGEGWADRRAEAIVKEHLRRYEAALDFTYLTDLEMSALLERLRQLPTKTIILYTAFSQDAAGTRFIDATQSIPMVVGAANAPVFVMMDQFIGPGTIGGYVSSIAAQGQVAAESAMRVLKGESPRDIPIVNGTNLYMFDWRALRRWGLRESGLPPGSTLLYRQPSLWQTYKRYVLGVAYLFALETLLILALLWQHAKRRKVERSLVVSNGELKKSEVILRESEERFRLVANTAPALIWMSATNNMCTFFNQGWLSFTGRSMEQELGEGWLSGVHPDDLERRLTILPGGSDAPVEFEVEYRLRSFDGEYRWIVDHGVPRFGSDGIFCGYIGSCVDITDRKMSEMSLRELSGRLIHAQEEERTRIARELHDDLSQRIVLLSISLEQFGQGRPGLSSADREQLHNIEQVATEVSSTIHNLSHQLHPYKLDSLGLVPSLRGLCREFSLQHRIQVQFIHQDVPPDIPKNVNLCLFRIAQEGLRNAMKHSGTAEARVELSADRDGIELCISDSGLGFDPETAKRESGLGLVSMRERLRLVSGNLSIESKPSHGTRIRARVPLPRMPGQDTSEQKQYEATA